MDCWQSEQKDSNGYKLAQQQQQQQALTGTTLSGSQKSVLVSSSRYLNIQRARESDAGIYECVASNSHDADLRKLVHVQVRGKYQWPNGSKSDIYASEEEYKLVKSSQVR